MWFVCLCFVSVLQILKNDIRSLHQQNLSTHHEQSEAAAAAETIETQTEAKRETEQHENEREKKTESALEFDREAALTSPLSSAELAKRARTAKWNAVEQQSKSKSKSKPKQKQQKQHATEAEQTQTQTETEAKTANGNYMFRLDKLTIEYQIVIASAVPVDAVQPQPQPQTQRPEQQQQIKAISDEVVVVNRVCDHESDDEWRVFLNQQRTQIRIRKAGLTSSTNTTSTLTNLTKTQKASIEFQSHNTVNRMELRLKTSAGYEFQASAHAMPTGIGGPNKQITKPIKNIQAWYARDTKVKAIQIQPNDETSKQVWNTSQTTKWNEANFKTLSFIFATPNRVMPKIKNLKWTHAHTNNRQISTKRN